MTGSEICTSLQIIKTIKDITDSMDKIRENRINRTKAGSLYTEINLYAAEFKELELHGSELKKYRVQLIDIISNNKNEQRVNDITAEVESYISALDILINRWDAGLKRDRKFLGSLSS